MPIQQLNLGKTRINLISIKSIFFAFLFVLLMNKVFGIPISIMFLIFLIVFVSNFVPSNYPIQKLAISSVFIIGLSPGYLLVRGFLTDAKLNRTDLYLYGLLAIILALIAAKKSFMKASISNQFREYFKNWQLIISASTGLIFGLLLEIYLLRQGLGYGVAWISSGDSKNHLLAGADLVRYGDLLPSTFLTQPINLPSTLSLLFSQIGSNLTNNPALLGAELEVYAFFWVVLIGITGVAFAATFQIMAGNHSTKKQKFALILLSLIPFSSIILGPALNDGFFTALFGITTLIVIANWFIELYQSEKFSYTHLLIGLAIFLTTLMSWMFITAFTLPLFLAGLRKILINKKVDRKLIDITYFVGALLGLLILHFTQFGQKFTHLVKVVLTATGAITTTKPSVYYSLILFLVIIGLLRKNISDLGKPLLIIAFLNVIGLSAFKYFSNLGLFSWNYYLLKYQWVMVASLFGIVAAIVFTLIYKYAVNTKFEIFSAIFAGFLVFILISESVSPEFASRTLPKVIRGWENPRGSILDFALKQNLQLKNPTMFFHYGYAGDAKLANFWMNAFLDPQDPVRGWNYTIDTSGDPKQLCDVNAYYPTVTVVTSDSKLESDLKQICPNEEFEIQLVPSAF